MATIGTHYVDRSSTKSDYFAIIENYVPFEYPVLAKQQNAYLEKIPPNKKSNYWRDGVREINEETYFNILNHASLSASPPHQTTLLNDVDASLQSGFEGNKSQKYVTVYERDRKLRAAAIALHGDSCLACGFNFRDFYGDYATGYIQIHHVVPISEADVEKPVNPSTDLVPLCANCHAVVHRRKDRTLSIDDLKEMLLKK
jgi:putative restriction endonuclease